MRVDRAHGRVIWQLTHENVVAGVLRSPSGLGIWRCPSWGSGHGCGMGLIPDQEISAGAMGTAKKKKKVFCYKRFCCFFLVWRVDLLRKLSQKFCPLNLSSHMISAAGKDYSLSVLMSNKIPCFFIKPNCTLHLPLCLYISFQFINNFRAEAWNYIQQWPKGTHRIDRTCQLTIRP